MRKKAGVDLATYFPRADGGALALLRRLLAFDPADRPSAEEALADAYFHNLHSPAREPSAQVRATAAARVLCLCAAAARLCCAALAAPAAAAACGDAASEPRLCPLPLHRRTAPRRAPHRTAPHHTGREQARV
jgi:hypothetical protein